MNKSKSRKRKTWNIENRALTQERRKQNPQDAREGKYLDEKWASGTGIHNIVALSSNLKLPPIILTYVMAFAFLQKGREERENRKKRKQLTF